MKIFEWLKTKLSPSADRLEIEELDISEREAKFANIPVAKNVEENLQILEQMVGPSADVMVRRFKVRQDLEAAIIFIDGLNDSNEIEIVLRSLMVWPMQTEKILTSTQNVKDILSDVLVNPRIREETNLAKAFSTISGGDIALFLNGYDKIIICDTKEIETRSITEPTAEVSIRGSREGFVENIRTNTSLIRRRIRTPNLWFEPLTIGSLSQTQIEIAYIKGLVEEDLIDEVRLRLDRIKTDSAMLSGYLEDFINDNPYTLFPQTKRTERVDVVTSALLEGRVAIFLDGTPFVLLIPASLIMFLQTPDDYAESVPAGTFFRIVRIISLFIAVILPGFYVAILNYHIELLPTDLLLRIMVTREGVPFPVIIEVLVMDFLFEILREAGIRLPDAVGSAVSIVGALILGDAAIRAGLVSPAVVIVIAMTAIANFSLPSFSLALSVRLLRFIFTILGGVFGLFGIQFGFFLVIIHLCALRSFGIPYLTPLAPFQLSDMRDFIVRYWRWGMFYRPHELSKTEPQRIAKGQKPEPPGKG